MTKTVLIAGATGYLGKHLVSEYASRSTSNSKDDKNEEDEGWIVKALVRSSSRARQSLPQNLSNIELVEAQATDPETLKDEIFRDVDLVISALGITRQTDKLSYMDVDYQANMNILNAARKSKSVKRFAYVHVLGADKMSQVMGIQAKQKFVDDLRSVSDMESTIINPSGFFSDMADFLDMAKQGRAYLFGDGSHKLNPIDGADLAKVIADEIDKGTDNLDVGGPEIFTHRQCTELAFEVLKQKEAKITYLPDWVRKSALWLVPKIAPRHIGGPAQMFLTAADLDMVGECRGRRTLKEHWECILAQEAEKKDMEG